MPRPAIEIRIGMTIAATTVLNTARIPTGRTATTIMIPTAATIHAATTITGIKTTEDTTTIGGLRFCLSSSGAEAWMGSVR
jgi:hypothetical protein